MTNLPTPRTVLFVCMGNICRSPAAEGVLQHLVVASGLEAAIAVDSAGTIDYHAGELPDARMRAAAARRGLNLSSRARQVKRHDFQSFDLIVPMDRTNLRHLESLRGSMDCRAELKLLSTYLNTERWPIDVPDPYYGGDDGFEFVLDMLEAACPRILDELRLVEFTPPTP
ncbi:MAG TPA: low molecular weight protein-tyrosine-phosphatase [Pirellulaceae bacterium]|nr:low molecular weight protein-tyrosine-phosphatase [Pirellulaceae bacterium]